MDGEEIFLMIAEPPSALGLLIRRLLDAREVRKRKEAEAARSVPVEGGRLEAKAERCALPPPRARPDGETALAPPPFPPTLPPMDILAMPDRDHQRTVEPDYDHIEYG